MCKKSHHLTYIDRQKLEILYNDKTCYHTQTDLARELGFSQQNISKELKRGKTQQLNGNTWEMYTIYSADIAQAKADYQKTAKGAPLKLSNDYKLADHIEERIMSQHFSPYAVIKEIKDDASLNFNVNLSVSTVYNYVHGGIFANVKPKHLPCKNENKNRKKKKPLEQRAAFRNALKPSITDRTVTREDFGHWEMDTVIGQAKGENNVLLVLTERKTRYEIIIKIHRKQSRYVVKALQSLRRQYGAGFKNVFKSIAVDNGTEFSDYIGMSRYAPVYYCHPYSSWERGSNENANAIIRRFIPKGCDMNKITNKTVRLVQNWMNNYPRKCINTTAQKAFDCEIDEILKAA